MTSPRHNKFRLLLAPAIVAVVGLTLAGCSNDDSGGDQKSSDHASSQSSDNSTSASPKSSSGSGKDSTSKPSTGPDSHKSGSDKSDAKSGQQSTDKSGSDKSGTKSGSKGQDKSGSNKSGPQAKGSSVARCTANHLTGSIKRQPGGGSAGHTGVYLVVKNTGKSPCLMKGYGGLSLVGDSNGTQLGAPADRTKAHVPSAVVLPGGHARAPVQISNAGNYGSNCHKATADGFRFYPPNETHSIFVKKSVPTCANKKLHLLQIKPFEPMS